MRVYVAGPITAATPEAMLENCEVAMRAGCRLMEAGHLAFVPHSSYFMHCFAERTGAYCPTWQNWIDLDLSILPVFQVMLRLPGPSRGADREEAAAGELGIPVFRSIEALLAWAAEGGGR